MATVQKLLDDIKLRYRHSFTMDQVLVWMSEEQLEIFENFEMDSPPSQLTTIAGQNLYPADPDVDLERVKVVTFQINSTNYSEVEFRRNDDDIPAGYGLWYTIISDMLYINYPGTMPDGRNIYLFVDNAPDEITSADLGEEPATPKKFQEILKLGTLARIAAARKDVLMKNNFEADKEQKIADFVWTAKMNEPDWVSPADVMPHTGGRWRHGSVAIITTSSG